MDEAGIAAFLKAEDLWDGPPEIRAMKGGYLNEVLRVTTGARRFVFKRFAEPSEGTLFPNLPQDEAQALRRLDGLEVAPRLVAFRPEHALLVYDYVEGAPWDGDITAVARLLMRKEAADPAGFRAVPVTPAAILAEGDALFARCRDGAPARRPREIALTPPRRLSLIHTDIGATNLIGDGPGLRLIDWQCPAAGDLAEDIYSFLSPAFRLLSLCEPFSAQEEATFLAALGDADAAGRYDRLRPFYAWRMAGYCRWRAQVHPDAQVRARYGAAAEAELIFMERAA